jgi:hypothetical protein
MIDPAVELSCEKKRLPLSAHQAQFQQQPRDPGVKNAIRYSETYKNMLAESPLKVPYRKFTSKSLHRLSI